MRYSMLLCVAGICLAGCSLPEVPLNDGWLLADDPEDRGIADGWYTTGYDRSAWTAARAGTDWQDYGLGAYDGAGWYARWFTYDLPDECVLYFGGVDDDAIVWVNGVQIGSHAGYADPFTVRIADSLRSDSMLVVVRVNDHALGGGIIGEVSAMTNAAATEKMRSPFADEQARVSEDWVRHAIVYEVYLRSFSQDASFRSLEGRLQELKDLGVTVIWLMPIHPIGALNRKGTLGSPYAIMDYRDVNPEFGSLDDLRSLVDAVHAHGMRIIIDLVANHTSWDNEMLLRHSDWYTRDDEGAIVAPNTDWSDVADLNYDRHELRKYMIDVMRYWVEEIGIDGYRADVAELVPTDFWEHARHELDDIRPVMMLAEGSHPELHLKAFDVTYAWTTYDILDDLIHGTQPVTVFADILKKEAARYPGGSLHLRFNTNHDKNKEDGPPVARWGEDAARLTAATMFVLPGIPLFYNGDEVANDRKLSLFEKVPIDWSRGEAMRVFYARLGKLRTEYPWLSTGPWSVLGHESNPRVLILLREEEDGEGTVLSVLNYSDEEVQIDIPMPERLKERVLEDYFTAARIPPAERIIMTLPPRGFGVLTPH